MQAKRRFMILVFGLAVILTLSIPPLSAEVFDWRNYPGDATSAYRLSEAGQCRT